MNRQKILAFLRAHIVDLSFNFITFITVVLVIVLPSTHVYFSVTHFGQIVKAIDKMQQVSDDTGNKGLSDYMKAVLSK